MLVLFIVAIVGNVVWSYHSERDQMISELHEKGHVLSQQMSAVWDFMSVNQDRLLETAYADNGAYQGLHCAIVGRSIGMRFTIESGYVTRFVNFDPRNKEDEPDDFEARALQAFTDDSSLKEYYEVDEYEGEEVFRYSAPMKIEKSCLECHGKPAGEIDVTGHPKEGWNIDDIGGAISIIMPMDAYRESTKASILQNLMYFIIILLLCLLVIYIALTHLVTRPLQRLRPMDAYRESTKASILQNLMYFIIILLLCLLVIYIALTHLVTRPLQRLRQAFGSMQEGNLDVRLNDSESSYELNAVVSEFNEMAHQLSDLYGMQEGNLDVRLNDSESSYELNAVVSEFNEMAHQLSDLYDSLESQVEERTAQLSRVNEALKAKRVQLEHANERLRNENQYKSDFLNMMSHELRTPLTSIIAFSEMLNRTGDPVDEKEAEIRREIEANSHVLLLMINDILEMSRLDAGKTQLMMETVDLGDIVGLVQSVVAPLSRRNKVAFTYSIDADVPLVTCDGDRIRHVLENLGDIVGLVQSVVAPLSRRNKVAFTYSIDADVPLVTCDGDRIRHVLENLCGNAMKFTPAGGSVTLHVSYDANADEVLLRVADTGIGIAEEDRERIFEKFVQADSSASRRYRGTGLGLALVREYTEMHGGHVELEGELGRGSAFIVHLPVKPVSGCADAAPSPYGSEDTE